MELKDTRTQAEVFQWCADQETMAYGEVAYGVNGYIGDALTRMAEIARAEALEEAAQLCDGLEERYKQVFEPDSQYTAEECAEAIRALQKTEGA